MTSDPGAFASYYPTFLRYIGVAIGIFLLMMLAYRLLRLLGARHEAATGFSLVLPWIIGFTIFTFFPIGLSFYLGFTEYNVLWDEPQSLDDPLANYKSALALKIAELPEGERPLRVLGELELGEDSYRYRELDRFTIGGKTYLLGATDPFFWKAIRLTLLYAVINVPLGLMGALGVALLLNQNIKGIGFWRTLYYLPAVLPGAAVALLWFWLFAPDSGLINWFFSPLYDLLGMTRPGWFTDKNLVLPSWVIMGMWGIFGANTVILLAGLKNIPNDLYEAAAIDGAAALSKFRHVTLPMLSPSMFYVLVTSVIGALQLFTQQAFIPTDRDDGWFINWLVYNEAFNFGHMGYASALGWMVALMIIVLTLFIFRSSSAWVFYEGAREKGAN